MNDGYILIDHRESPGLGGPLTTKGQRFEGATNTCSHCSKVVIQNPLRTRERGHCSKCDYFICDPCQADMYLGGECRCFNVRVDELLKTKGAA